MSRLRTDCLTELTRCESSSVSGFHSRIFNLARRGCTTPLLLDKPRRPTRPGRRRRARCCLLLCRFFFSSARLASGRAKERSSRGSILPCRLEAAKNNESCRKQDEAGGRKPVKVLGHEKEALRNRDCRTRRLHLERQSRHVPWRGSHSAWQVQAGTWTDPWPHAVSNVRANVCKYEYRTA